MTASQQGKNLCGWIIFFQPGKKVMEGGEEFRGINMVRNQDVPVSAYVYF